MGREKGGWAGGRVGRERLDDELCVGMEQCVIVCWTVDQPVQESCIRGMIR